MKLPPGSLSAETQLAVRGKHLISLRLAGPGRGYSDAVCAPPFTQRTAGNLGVWDARRANPGYGVVNKIARGGPDAATIPGRIGLELMQEVTG